MFWSFQALKVLVVACPCSLIMAVSCSSVSYWNSTRVSCSIRADSLPMPEELELTVTLNGDVVQHAFGREMIFSIAEQIAYASHLYTLRPGDVIATGSPDGTGGSRDPKRFLKSGNKVTISIGSACTLINSVRSDL